MSIVALLAAAAVWHFSPMWNGQGAPTASVRADLTLQLQRAGSDYRVAWDAKSPVVLAAKRGTLFIKDGTFEKELALDRDQLLSAAIVYSPATTDVSFRLEVFGAGPEPAVATVRLLAGSKPEVAAEAPVLPAPEAAPPVTPAVETAAPPAAEAQPQATEQPQPEESTAEADQPPTDAAPATMAAAPPRSDIPGAERTR